MIIPRHEGVRIATPGDMDAVYRLTYSCFASKGYCLPREDGRLIYGQSLDAASETTTFLYERHGAALGTISFTIDGPSGLHTDATFPAETAAERARCDASGLTLAASWRIATDPTMDRAENMAVVSAILNRGFIHLECLNADVLLCTFNPKHERIWQRLVGLRTIAGPKPDPSVDGAPAVLMIGDLAAMRAHWKARRNACESR